MRRLFLIWIVILFLGLFLFNIPSGWSQEKQSDRISADFTIPDTACAGYPITIINNSVGATTYFWKFCSGSTTQNPLGINLGNPFGMLSTPTFMTLVKQSGHYYSFITNLGTGSLIRYDHGSDLMSVPAAGVDLGTFGLLTINARGIQIKEVGGLWYGFVVDADHIIRLEFGTSITNVPMAVDLGSFIQLREATGFVLVNEGGHWYGIIGNYESGNLTRADFGTQLTNAPTLTDLGTFGYSDHPFQFALTTENGNWYALINSSGQNGLLRLNFGSSLSNVPTPDVLGNLASFEDNRGVVISSDCGKVTGFITQHTTNPDRIARLDFSSGVSGPITAHQIGNIGNLDRPSSFSELIHVGDTAYTFVVNMTNSTLTLLFFPDCNNASIPSTTLQNPLPIQYNAAGTYTIKLIVDEGLPTQQTVCKTIVIVETPTINLGSDRFLCQGTEQTLTAPEGYADYTWNTGAKTEQIAVTLPGKYWVQVKTTQGCEATDSVLLMAAFPGSSTSDTSICAGESLFAGGDWRTTSGIYYDTLSTNRGCDSVLTTHLFVKPDVPINLGRDSSICTGSSITLDATTNGASGYLWSNGSAGSQLIITEPGTYWVEVTVDDCLHGDTIVFGECPPKLWFPTAFTPNGDGLNDTFQPVGVSISNYLFQIFDRSGMLIYESQEIAFGWNGEVGGQLSPAGVYSFVVHYETLTEPGVEKRQAGTFTLLR